VDLVDTIRPGMGKFRDVPRLEFDDVADWVADYGKKFGFSSGIFDQWAGIPFEQAEDVEKRTLFATTRIASIS